MSVNAVDWVIRFAPVDAKHDGEARVLLCLANVADDEGRNAHPVQRKLAAWCQCSVPTIKRRLKWLEDNGLIRRGDQRLAGHFPEWHRPIVWDLCLDMRRETADGFFDANDIDATVGGRPKKPETGNPVGMREHGNTGAENENPSSPVNPGYMENGGENGREKPQLTCEPRFTAVTPPPAHLVSYSTSLVHPYNPSTPTGYLPANGENPPESENPKPNDETPHAAASADADPGSGPTFRDARLWIDPNAKPDPGTDDLPADIRGAGFVCEALEAGWAKTPRMPVPRPVAGRHKRETTAARRLIDEHGLETAVKVALWATSPAAPDAASVSGGRPYDGFWRKTITGARSLRSKWDALVAQMADDRDGRATLASIGRIDAAPAAPKRGDAKAPSYGIPDELDRQVTALLPDLWEDDGCDEHAARLKLRELLGDHPDADERERRALADQAVRHGRRRMRERREAEAKADRERSERERAAKAALDAYRKANGGSCFIGARRGEGAAL